MAHETLEPGTVLFIGLVALILSAICKASRERHMRKKKEKV